MEKISRSNDFFSLDGIGEINDYIRVRVNYEEVVGNIQVILKQKSVKKIVCSYTFQALNAFDLPNLIKFLIKEPRIIFHCNILYNPDFLNVHIFPKNIKHELIEKYIFLKNEVSGFKINDTQKYNYISSIDILISYLEKPIDNYKMREKFIEYNSEVDKKYNIKKSFKEIVPELKCL